MLITYNLRLEIPASSRFPDVVAVLQENSRMPNNLHAVKGDSLCCFRSRSLARHSIHISYTKTYVEIIATLTLLQWLQRSPGLGVLGLDWSHLGVYGRHHVQSCVGWLFSQIVPGCQRDARGIRENVYLKRSTSRVSLVCQTSGFWAEKVKAI